MKKHRTAEYGVFGPTALLHRAAEYGGYWHFPECRQSCVARETSSHFTKPITLLPPTWTWRGGAPGSRLTPLYATSPVFWLSDTTGVNCCGVTLVSRRTARTVAVAVAVPATPHWRCAVSA